MSIEKTILVGSSAESPKQSEGTMLRLMDGRILFLWSQFLDTERMSLEERPQESSLRQAAYTDDGYARICAKTSDDEGRSWSEKRVVVDDRDALINCICPALSRLPDGRIALLYSWRSGGIYDGKLGSAARRLRVSSDEGESWSEPVRITPAEGYHTGAHDRLRTLSSGRLIAPCHTILKPGKDQEMAVYTAFSDDGGASWRYSDWLFEPRRRRFEEGCLAERADGSLLMVMRTYLGQGFLTESRDGGASWSEPQPSGVVASAAPTYLTRLPGSHRLLMVWNPDFNPDIPWSRGNRCPLLCATSDDGGGHWGLPLALETNPEFWWEYPGVFFTGEEALIHYRRTRRDRKRSDIVLARLPLGAFEG